MPESPLPSRRPSERSARNPHATLRASSLCGIALAGIIGLAYGVSMIPLRYSAQATFDLPEEVSAEFGQLPVNPQAVYDALSRLGVSPGLAVHHPCMVAEPLGAAPSPTRFVITAELDDPALVQRFVLQLAREVAAEYLKSAAPEKQPANLPVMPRPDHQVTPVSHANPTVESADVVCMPALSPSHRAKNQTLLENALAECLAQRERWTARYTKQHPVVASLDRKIQLLKQEMETPYAPAEPERSSILQTSAHDGDSLAIEPTPSPTEGRSSTHHQVLTQPRLGPESIKYVGMNRRMIFVTGTLVLIAICVGIEVIARRRLVSSLQPVRVRRP